MLAKDAVAHIVSLLPESMNFEEIIEALSLIYSDKCGLEDCDEMRQPVMSSVSASASRSASARV